MDVCSPAGVSLAAAGVDALWQGVVQGGFDHVEADGLLMHFAARVPARQKRKNSTEPTEDAKTTKKKEASHFNLIPRSERRGHGGCK